MAGFQQAQPPRRRGGAEVRRLRRRHRRDHDLRRSACSTACYGTLDVGEIGAMVRGGQRRAWRRAIGLIGLLVGDRLQDLGRPVPLLVPGRVRGRQRRGGDVPVGGLQGGRADAAAAAGDDAWAASTPARPLAAASGQIALAIGVAGGRDRHASATWPPWRQNNLKRLLAYSSIAHAGYMLMAVAILSGSTGRAADHAVPAGLPADEPGGLLRGGHRLQPHRQRGHLGVLRAWAGGRPLLAVSMTLFMLSLVGLPPLAGLRGQVPTVLRPVHLRGATPCAGWSSSGWSTR